jgi:pimeloyl-ACP methyl ester carboxylesterase
MIRRMLKIFATVALLSPAGAQAEDKFFDSNGVKIRYSVEGSGEPVLLIHGFTVDLDANWRAPGLIAALTKTHQVIAYDNRGHGKSDKPHDPKQYGMEMVFDAVRLLDHLKINKAHVVGYSMGASIANKLLTTHPDRLISVTLGGNAGKLEGADFSLHDRMVEDLESGRGISGLLGRLTPPGRPKPTEEQLKAVNAALLANNDIKALAAVVRGLRQLAIPQKELKENKIPVLALIGSLDPLIKEVDLMSTQLAGMSTVVIEGADHMNTVGTPAFEKELNLFLNKHSISK